MTLEKISTRSLDDMYHRHIANVEQNIFFHSLLPEFLCWRSFVNEYQLELVKKSVDNARSEFKPMKPQDRELRNHGVLLVEHREQNCYLTQSLIDSLIKVANANVYAIADLADQITRGEKNRLISVDDIFSISSCDGIHLTPAILRLCWNYFEGPFRISRRPSFVLDAVTPQRLNKSKDTQLYHSDPDDFKMLKFFIYLNDVTGMNGPFEYLMNSHQQPYIRYFSPSEGCRLSDLQPRYLGFDEVLTCVGKAGTMVVADTVGLHRGKPHQAGHRLRMQFMATSVQPLLETFVSSSVEIACI